MSLSGIQIQFHERMQGWASLGGTGFTEGAQAGQAAGLALVLEVDVQITDLAQFLSDPSHHGQLRGFVSSPLLGGEALIEQGDFQLLSDSADENRQRMIYRAHCRNGAGELFTFSGEKKIQSHGGLDIWQDTTTLYSNLFVGALSPAQEASADLLACGILSLDLGQFMQVLRSLRAVDGVGQAHPEGLAAFGKFFAQGLWQVYAPQLGEGQDDAPRRYPRDTLQGVSGATTSMHPFSTADGLGLYLTRFQRRPCTDVVLIIHGLTTSSDMFIMPEHQNLVQTLLDEGFADVFTLDHRGSHRFPYNQQRSHFNLDDLALFDHPAAVHTLRQIVGPLARIHVIAHCVGALTFAMSVAAGQLSGIRSMVLNSIGLLVNVPAWSHPKLAVGPWACDYLLGVEFMNPQWRSQSGWSLGKLLAMGVDTLHRECDSSVCHMLSFMWGAGSPALFMHENMHPHTHERLGDLFGGISVNYYRHIHQMLHNQHKACKFSPAQPRHAALPAQYCARLDQLPPMLLTTGQENRVFANSIQLFHAELEKNSPGRHHMHVFPRYGHQDVFMGQNCANDIFPLLLQFIESQRNE